MGGSGGQLFRSFCKAFARTALQGFASKRPLIEMRLDGVLWVSSGGGEIGMSGVRCMMSG